MHACSPRGGRSNWVSSRSEHDGAVGMMTVEAAAFSETRCVNSGSWLLPEWRGQGLGREAREAMLHLVFAELGAREARSAAHPDNAPSRAVSRALGYRADGTDTVLGAAGSAIQVIRLLLDRDGWEAIRRTDITVRGAHSPPALRDARGIIHSPRPPCSRRFARVAAALSSRA